MFNIRKNTLIHMGIILLLFMYVFAFPIFKIELPLVNSSYLTGCFLAIFFLVNSQYRQIVLTLYKKIQVTSLYSMGLLIFLYSVIVVLIFATKDYSFSKTYINLLMKLAIGYFIFCLYVLNIDNKNSNLLCDIIYIFIIQSIIQLTSMLLPITNNFWNLFRSPSVVKRALEVYKGTRGLSVAGSGFFGIAIAYGLIMFYYIVYRDYLLKNLKILKGNKVYYFIIFFLLLFGSFAAGRIAFLGIGIGLVYVMFERIFLYKKSHFHQNRAFGSLSKKTLILLSILTIFFIVFIAFGFYLIYSYKFSADVPKPIRPIFSFFRYVFSGTYTYIHYGKFEISSLETLKDMYFKIDNRVLFLGSGNYTNPDGTYFMKTDPGYMRNILFFGLYGVLILFAYQLMFFNWSNKNKQWENVFILLYIVLLHFKGEALGFAQYLLQILLLMYLLDCYKIKRGLSNDKTTFLDYYA